MGKKKRKGRKPPKPVTEAEYIRRLTRGGLASLGLIAQYEAHVIADPGEAERRGTTQAQMLEELAAMRKLVTDDVVRTSIVAAVA